MWESGEVSRCSKMWQEKSEDCGAVASLDEYMSTLNIEKKVDRGQ